MLTLVTLWRALRALRIASRLTRPQLGRLCWLSWLCRPSRLGWLGWLRRLSRLGWLSRLSWLSRLGRLSRLSRLSWLRTVAMLVTLWRAFGAVWIASWLTWPRSRRWGGDRSRFRPSLIP
jgi:hypothetical protein